MINVLEKHPIKLFCWFLIGFSCMRIKKTLWLWLGCYLRHPFTLFFCLFVCLSNANKLKWECQQFQSRKVLPGDSINPPNGGARSYVAALIWKETCSLSRVQTELSEVRSLSCRNLLKHFISELDYFKLGLTGSVKRGWPVRGACFLGWTTGVRRRTSCPWRPLNGSNSPKE